MCDPITVAALAATTTGVSLYAQNEQASYQRDLIRANAEAEKEEARAQAEEELGDRVRETRAARSRFRVAAGESGAQGASFAAAINQSIQDQDEQAARAAKNLAFSKRGIDARRDFGLSQARSVSAVEAGLSIATAGIRGYQAGGTIKRLKAGETT